MKFRIQQIITVEYDVNPEFYLPDATTPEEMLQVDMDAAAEDPGLFWNDEDSTITVNGEIIKEDKNG